MYSRMVYKKTVTTITTTVFQVPRGVEQKRFQQSSASTHSGAGEKETLTINAGKICLMYTYIYIYTHLFICIYLFTYIVNI